VIFCYERPVDGRHGNIQFQDWSHRRRECHRLLPPGDILVDIAAPLAVGVFLGSLLGARLAPRIRTKYVSICWSAIMLYLAGHLLAHLLKECSMSQLREPAFDRVVAMVLRGAPSVVSSSCWLVCWLESCPRPIPADIERAGVLLMLATPVVRVAVAGVLFLREKDGSTGNLFRSTRNPAAGRAFRHRRTLKRAN